MLSVGWEEQCGRRGLPLWDSSASQFIGSCEDFLEAEGCKKLFKIRHLLDMFVQLYKGAGTFHSAGQSKEGNLVLALPTIRFSWNFYQIISDTKYEYETSFGLITCHSWIMAKNGLFFHRILTYFFYIFHRLRLYLCSKRDVCECWVIRTGGKSGCKLLTLFGSDCDDGVSAIIRGHFLTLWALLFT